MAVSVPRYTVDDLDNFPDDGNRYELLDGILLVTPAPLPVHQIVATRLIGPMHASLGTPGHAHVVGPGAISFPPGTQLQPDILVYPARFSPSLHWAKVTEHWLAVEVLSRSSRIYDREFKRDAYFALGVREVWLVDIRGRMVEAWRSRTTREDVHDILRWPTPVLNVEIRIDLAELFSGVD